MAKRAASRIGKQKEREKKPDIDPGPVEEPEVSEDLSFRRIAALFALNGMLSGAEPDTAIDMRLCWAAADELLSCEDE